MLERRNSTRDEGTRGPDCAKGATAALGPVVSPRGARLAQARPGVCARGLPSPIAGSSDELEL